MDIVKQPSLPWVSHSRLSGTASEVIKECRRFDSYWEQLDHHPSLQRTQESWETLAMHQFFLLWSAVLKYRIWNLINKTEGKHPSKAPRIFRNTQLRAMIVLNKHIWIFSEVILFFNHSLVSWNTVFNHVFVFYFSFNISFIVILYRYYYCTYFIVHLSSN